MKQRVNATLQVSFINWGDIEQKYPLMFAANEDFDLVFTSSWAKYNETANKNGFYELTPELLQKYAPVTYERQPKVAWEQAKINGKIYMVPNDNFEVVDYLSLIRGDLREKYNIPPVQTIDDLGNYLKTVAKNEKGLNAYSAAESFALDSIALYQANEWYEVTTGLLGLAYKMTDPSGTIFSVYDTPEMEAHLKRVKDWADSGIWSRNAVVAQEDPLTVFQSGKSAMMAHNLGTLSNAASQVIKDHPEWKPEIIDVNPEAKRFLRDYLGNGMAIHATSKNPERALMVIDLLRYDKEIHDLTNLGIEGKHWEAVGEDQFKSLPDSQNFLPGSACPWGWNSLTERQSADTPPIKEEILAKWKSGNIVEHELQMFFYDQNKMKTELAAIENVLKTYYLPLQYGMVDPVKGLATLKQKLNEAGFEKVKEDLQRQLDEFRQANP
ncbi:ABC transporter substrate-binding protein [Cohnella hongkongensis]|uniref:ABC transporter substrate-binding protein n=1 Tax=Cohnella hongkongensis TaxID=178337 RepID=A0ABV9F939_9BACL